MKVTVIARKSALSQIQAHEVLQRLAAKYPSLEISVIKREVEGDLDLITPLAHFDQRGVFTREFSEILTSGAADIAVHSWKDLPTENRFDTEIAATLPRADQRDVLLFKRSSIKKAPKAIRILTSSPRREWALQRHIGELLPWRIESIECAPVRGTIPTRVGKLLESEFDGLVVAKAALDRILGSMLPEIEETKQFLQRSFEGLNWMILPLRLFPNAPAQGALALEISSKRDDLRDLLRGVNCEKTFSAVAQERRILSGYGGGCHQKIGAAVIDRHYGRICCVTGETSAGQCLDRFTLERSTSDGLTRSLEPAKLWSSSDVIASHFERCPLKVAPPKTPSLLYITKEQALPDDWDISMHLAWSAGITTWRKLAARGVWVHGSNEGLGDVEIPDLTMYVNHPLSAVRLTHLGVGHRGLSDNSILNTSTEELTNPLAVKDHIKVLQTYQLKLTKPLKIPTDITHCYWSSGSVFEQALEQNPHILKMHHSSGPGSTYECLKSHHELILIPAVCLSEADWRAELEN